MIIMFYKTERWQNWKIWNYYLQITWGGPCDAYWVAAAAAAKSLQSCQTLCDPRDGSPPGSPVPGILQARTLEWVAISFSNAWKWKVKVKSLSHVRLLATPWTAAHQAPPSMGFSVQEYWSGVPLRTGIKQCLYYLWSFRMKIIQCTGVIKHITYNSLCLYAMS